MTDMNQNEGQPVAVSSGDDAGIRLHDHQVETAGDVAADEAAAKVARQQKALAEAAQDLITTLTELAACSRALRDIRKDRHADSEDVFERANKFREMEAKFNDSVKKFMELQIEIADQEG